MFVIHKCWWEKVYNQKKEVKIRNKMTRNEWENKECDNYFKKWILSNNVSYLAVESDKIKLELKKTN